MSSPDQIVSVGIIACGEEVAQTVLIPQLTRMGHLFRITYLYDESPAALKHYSTTLEHPVKTTQNPEELCASAEVQVVVVASLDVYHASHAILALKHDKSVFIDKPVALTKQDALAIETAESKSKGRVTFGYTARFAPPLEDAVRDMGGMDNILYARLRDSIVPLLSNTSSDVYQQFSDVSDSYEQDTEAKDWELTQRALLQENNGVHVTFASSRIWKALSSQGSFQLSAMRTVLGLPIRVGDSYSGVSSWTVLFQYPTFILSYESGVDAVPITDADVELHGEHKIIRMRYDRASAGKMSVQLNVLEHKDGVDVEKVLLRSYDDPSTVEMKKLWELAVGQGPAESTMKEAIGDLEVSHIVMDHFHTTEA